ncbi:hypothetical protein [Lacinutrix jangbogonensis]|uniref:hypothetical protein n=1 Tax=Lacinutrix jangbogonensis TaxID=1469557 RepID=UPI000AC2D65E|nr:hypothetical protein [Lacinutrix jangbogonensis]
MKTLKITLFGVLALALFTSFSSKDKDITLADDLVQNETTTIYIKNGAIDMTMTPED